MYVAGRSWHWVTTPVRSSCAICSASVRSRLSRPHLPGLAHPERRERIDHVIPKRVLLQEGANRLPHVPGGLERKVHLTVFSAGSTRRAALHELVESRSGVRNLKAREALSTRIEHDHLVLTSRQIDAHEDIV